MNDKVNETLLTATSAIPGVEPWIVLSFAAIIFFIGLTGIMIRRNILIILMCIELMLNAINLTFVTFSVAMNDLVGQMSVFFIITVAAAESAVGLGLVIAMFRTLRSVDSDDIRMLRE
jgi:NADH-quinone oxidoreductase subunit K